MVLILVGLSRVLMVLILVGLWRAGKFWNPGAWWALSRGGIGVSPWVMTLVDLGNSANSAYLSNLQKVDQSFTAKDLGRDVIDICIGNRWYIGLTHVEFSECFFVSQHSSNVNLTRGLLHGVCHSGSSADLIWNMLVMRQDSYLKSQYCFLRAYAWNNGIFSVYWESDTSTGSLSHNKHVSDQSADEPEWQTPCSKPLVGSYWYSPRMAQQNSYYRY